MRGTPTLAWAWLLFSMLGVRVPTFALGIWVFQRTGSATSYSWALTWTVLPAVLLSPFAGLAADRLGGRRVSLLAIACAGLGCGAALLMETGGGVGVWPLHLALASCAASLALTLSSFHASLGSWAAPGQLGRSHGALQLMVAVCELVGPLGVWLAPGQELTAWLWCGAAAQTAAVCALLAVPFPQAAAQARRAHWEWFAQVKDGFRFVWSARPLRALMLLVCAMHLGLAMGVALFTPHVLERASLRELGGSMLLYGAGMGAGGLLLTAWGGPRRQGRGVAVLGALAGATLCAAGIGRDLAWEAAVFAAGCVTSMLVGSAHALFQARVPGPLQGRVFGLRSTVIRLSAAIGYLAAGRLLEHTTHRWQFGAPGAVQPAGDVSGLLLVVVGAGMLLTAGFFLIHPDVRALDEPSPAPSGISPPLAPETAR